MELVLNLFWSLLLVPVVYLWRNRNPRANRWRLAVALLCLLFILFPVISASDDLRALSQEIEESAPRKGFKGGEFKTYEVDSFALLLPSAATSSLARESCGIALLFSAAAPGASHAHNSVSRSPPFLVS